MKRQIREGQPLSSRNTKPSMKRDRFDYNVNENAVERLGKIFTKLGAVESDPKEGVKMSYEAVQHWYFSGKQALSQKFSGDVYIAFNGKVNYEFHVRDYRALDKSFVKILERAGFRVSQLNFDMDGNPYNSKYYKDASDVGFIYFTGTFKTVEDAVRAFSKLYVILSKANNSYDTFNTTDDREYYAKKGYVSDDPSYPFSIVRDSDGSEMISGQITPDGFIMLDGYGDGDDTLTWREASSEILSDLRSFGFHTEGSLNSTISNVDSSVGIKNNLKTMIDVINGNSHARNADLDPDTDDIELFCDDLAIEYGAPIESEYSMNDARKKRLTKMKATAANDAAHRYESHRKIKEDTSNWNKETNGYAKQAFNVIFNLIDGALIDEDTDDEQAEEEFRAENNEMFQNVLQGIYHALEQFCPNVGDIMDPEMIFGDEIFSYLA